MGKLRALGPQLSLGVRCTTIRGKLDNSIKNTDWNPSGLLIAAALLLSVAIALRFVFKHIEFIPQVLIEDYIELISMMLVIMYLQRIYPLKINDFWPEKLNKAIAVGFLGGLLVSVGNLKLLFSVTDKFDQNDFIGFGTGIFNASAYLVISIIIIPIAEEIIFRGNVYRVLKNRYDIFWATLVTCILWTIMHGNITAAITGVLFIAIYEYTKSLGSCILAHIMTNAIYFVAVYSHAGHLTTG